MNASKKCETLSEFVQKTVSQVDVEARKVQLLALFDLSDERGKEYLLRVAGVTASLRKD